MDDQQRAREWLAAEYKKAGWLGAMDDALSETPSPHCQVTIAAITAALRAAPEAVALRTAMRALQQIASTPRNKGARVSAMATLQFLQTQLAARPQGVRDRPPIDGCTESNCKRCRTHPDHRGDIEHAGIGWRPDSPQEASDAT